MAERVILISDSDAEGSRSPPPGPRRGCPPLPAVSPWLPGRGLPVGAAPPAPLKDGGASAAAEARAETVAARGQKAHSECPRPGRSGGSAAPTVCSRRARYPRPHPSRARPGHSHMPQGPPASPKRARVPSATSCQQSPSPQVCPPGVPPWPHPPRAPQPRVSASPRLHQGSVPRAPCWAQPLPGVQPWATVGRPPSCSPGPARGRGEDGRVRRPGARSCRGSAAPGGGAGPLAPVPMQRSNAGSWAASGTAGPAGAGATCGLRGCSGFPARAAGFCHPLRPHAAPPLGRQQV